MTFYTAKLDYKMELLKQKERLERELNVVNISLSLINDSTPKNKNEPINIIESDSESDSSSNKFNTKFISNESNKKKRKFSETGEKNSSDEDDSDTNINRWLSIIKKKEKKKN